MCGLICHAIVLSKGLTMIRFLLRRFFSALGVLWIVVTAVFFLMNTVGDPAAAHLGPRAHATQLKAFRIKHGLDRPLVERYAKLMLDLAHGDLGHSFRTDTPVTEVIASRIPRTALLGALSTVFELTFGLLLGVIAAMYRKRWIDTSVMGLTFIGMSAPSFILGLLFLDVLAFRLGWFPVGGYGVTTMEHIQHALLPSLTLAVLGAATYARMMRSELVDALRADYIRTARAKGASRLRTVWMHGVRNALLPVITLMGLQLSVLVSGAIITESIFGWPGMGRLAVESMYNPDFPVIIAIVLISCTAIQIGNLVADVCIASLDPRIRLQD